MPMDENKIPNKKKSEPVSEQHSGGGAVNLPTLRTYKQDVADLMHDQKVSLVRLVLEEQKERTRREQEKSPTSRVNLPLILLSIVFFLSSAGLVYYIFFSVTSDDDTLKNLHIVPIILAEKNKEILTNGKNPQSLKKEIVAIVRNMNLKVDSIDYLFFTDTLRIQTQNGLVEEKNLIPSSKFFEVLGIQMPPALLRSLNKDFMFGIHSFNKNQPFFILKTDYYDNAFAGMLAWESNMAQELLPFFDKTEQMKNLSQKTWSDIVIKNKDTRELRDFDGNTVLVYMFKDQNTLIITTSEDTLLEVSRRLDLIKERK